MRAPWRLRAPKAREAPREMASPPYSTCGSRVRASAWASPSPITETETSSSETSSVRSSPSAQAAAREAATSPRSASTLPLRETPTPAGGVVDGADRRGQVLRRGHLGAVDAHHVTVDDGADAGAAATDVHD